MASSILKLFLSSIILYTMLQPYTKALRKASMLIFNSLSDYSLRLSIQVYICSSVSHFVVRYAYNNISQIFCLNLIFCIRPTLYTWENTLMVQILHFVILIQPQILTMIYWLQSWEGNVYNLSALVQVLCIKNFVEG